MFKQYRKLWWGLLALVVLTPLGLIAAGTAFGEWGTEQLAEEVGFIPQGLAAMADFWKYAVLPDYAIPGLDSTIGSVIGYVASAVIGVALVIGIITLLNRLIKE